MVGEILTFVSDEFTVDYTRFAVVGTRSLEHDLVLKRGTSVSGVEETTVPLNDLTVEDARLRRLLVPEGKVIRGWKFTVHSSHLKSEFRYFEQDQAVRMNAVVRQTLKFYLEGK
jgi:hypothetical protein